MAQSTAVDYSKLENDHVTEVKSSFQSKLKMRNYTSGNNFRHAILGYVVDEKYDLARSETEAYVNAKSDYPLFRDKSLRFIEHCQNLISAIEAKRGFHGMGALSYAKQQELFDKVIQHFDELTDSLKRIEHIERDLRIEDVRSTVWVLQTIFVCASAIMITGLMIEVDLQTLFDFGVLIESWANGLFRLVTGLFS